VHRPPVPRAYAALVTVDSPPPGHRQRPETVVRPALKVPLYNAGEPTSAPRIVAVSFPTFQTYSGATLAN
jgi:hypothetical protein